MTNLFFASALMLLVTGVAATPQASDEAEGANEQLVRRMIEAVNARDLAALDAIVAPDVVRHSAATAGVVVRSLDDFKKFLLSDFAAIPDSVIEVEHLISEGDLVAVRASYSGTQMGAMGPFPASDERFEGPFLSFLRIANGKIAEMWVEWDNLAMLTQLGHLPPPPPSRASTADAQRIASDFLAAWNDPQAKRMAALLAGDVEYVEVATSRRFKGPESIVEWVRSTHRWAPDIELRLLNVVAQHDVIAVEWMMEGTQTGEWPEVRTTGKRFSVAGLSILELKDGRIAKGRDYWDQYDLMRQLGLVPAPGE